MGSTRKTAGAERQHKKERAAAHAAGRVAGLRDALLLLGVGVGLGLAGALAPYRSGRCPKRSLVFGTCRLDANHEGDCQPEGLLP